MATGGASNPYSQGFEWLDVLTPEELQKMPNRDSPEYLPFCKKAIEDLNKKLEVSEEEKERREAEAEIANLLS